MRIFRLLPALLLLLAVLRADATIEEEQALARADFAKIRSQLNSITFERFELKDATLAEAVEFLRQKCKEADPSHHGVNFVIEPAELPFRGKVSFDLKHVTLKQILRELRKKTAYSYVPQQFAIFLSSPPFGDMLYSRTFVVPKGSFSIKQLPQTITYDVKEQLTAQGVIFPPGTSAEYTPGKSQLLMVTADLDEMEKVEDLLEAKSGVLPPSSLPPKPSALNSGK